MSIMAEWYGLKDGRDDFQIMTYEDRAYFFARSELDKKLTSQLKGAFRAARPPRLVLYGDWGVGKTHTMRHLEYEIEQNDGYNGLVVFIELPDIVSKSTFQVAQAALLDALGMQTVQGWIYQYQAKHQSEARERLKSLAQSEDIATALLQITSPGNNGRICWDWLRGIKVSTADASAVGLPPHLEQSAQLVTVLRLLGVICKELNDKILVFMIDECTKIRDVSNADAEKHWTNAFKILSQTENKDIGIIVSISENDQDDFPRTFSDQQIRTRFGKANFVQLNRFTKDETAQFLKDLFENVINAEKRKGLLEKYKSEAGAEEIAEDTFPFTKDAFDEFLNATEEHDQATPRDALNLIEEVLNRSIDEERHIINSDLLIAMLQEG